jgi:hypothetical protein
VANCQDCATFGWLQVQNTVFQPENTYHKSSYSSANIMWNIYGTFSVGGEFMYGWVKEMGGATATAPAFKFPKDIPSLNCTRSKSKISS